MFISDYLVRGELDKAITFSPSISCQRLNNIDV